MAERKWTPKETTGSAPRVESPLPVASLRDYFAGQALVGILAAGSDLAEGLVRADRSPQAFAYDVAEAMLREREADDA